MICMSCRKVHFPPQRGPTADGLKEIETIRARDHDAYLELKAEKAKQRKKARAKPRKEDTDVDVPEQRGRPFRMLNNDEVVFPGSETEKIDEDEKPKIKSGPRNYLMKGKQANAGNEKGNLQDQGKLEDERTVQLVFWAEHQEPFIQQVPVQFQYELFLYEFEKFQGMRDVFAFERYSFEASLWCDLPWRTSPIWIAPEDDVIFVRAWGVKCEGFGRQLERYQRMHGLALKPALGIRASINIPPAGHHWLILWGAHRPEPEIYPVDLSFIAGLDDDARVALPWAHLIVDAPFLLRYRETDTSWRASIAGETSEALDAPLTLLAHPSAEWLVGSGEAIAWLDEWRLGRDPKPRPKREVKERPAKRERSRPAKPKASRSTASISLTRGNRASKADAGPAEDDLSKALAMAGEWFAALSQAPVSKPKEELPVGGGSNLASSRVASAASPDEEKIPQRPGQAAIANSEAKIAKVEGALVPTGLQAAPAVPYAPDRPASTISDDKVHHLEGASQSRVELLHRTDPHAPQPYTSASSDDDVEIVEGPAQPRHSPNPGAVPPVARSAFISSDDDVEFVEGPEKPRLAHDPPAVAAAAARSASTSSDDDVEFVEGPAQPRVELPQTAIQAAAARSSSASSDDDVEIVEGAGQPRPAHDLPAAARAASPSSDDDVEIVEGPAQPPVELAQPAISSDDDVEIVEGPAQTRITHGQPAIQPYAARSASTSSDEVEILEGPAQPRIGRDQSAVQAATARSTTASSHDDVGIDQASYVPQVAMPHAPRRPASATHDEEAMVEGGPQQLLVPGAHTVPRVPEPCTRTASDDEAEMVDEPALPRVGPFAHAMPNGHRSCASTSLDGDIEMAEGPVPPHVVSDEALSQPHPPPPIARAFAEDRLQLKTGCSHHVLNGLQAASSDGTALMGGGMSAPSATLSSHDGGVKSEAGKATGGEVLRVPKRPASPLFDSGMDIAEERMPQEQGCSQPHKKMRTSGTAEKKVDQAAAVASGISKTSALVDDDIVWIEAPSDELKRAFVKKTATSGPAVPPADTCGSSTGNTAAGASSTDSDDEVEFVDNATVVPKRRVSNVHGKQVIDMT